MARVDVRRTDDDATDLVVETIRRRASAQAFSCGADVLDFGLPSARGCRKR
jgi:hypothetical protein